MLEVRKNVKMPLIAGCAAIGGMFLYQYLSFVPEYSAAVTTIETPVYDESKRDTRTLLDITYMQEMTAGVCERSEKLASKQLIDKRDGKSYWVAKLIGAANDTNSECWMTQNLALDLSISKSLTPAESDVQTEWQPETSTINGNLSGWQNSTSSPQSWNPGLYIYANVADGWSTCGDGLKTLAGCNRWKLLDGNWRALANLSSGDITSSINDNTKTYDAHYLSGNYYNYVAATAGSLSESGDSVCPKAWRLPTISEYAVLKQSGSNGSVLTSSNIRQAPVYFVPGGFANADGVSTASALGNYWASTPATSGRAYSFYFNSANVYADSHYGAQIGRSVRCINRTDVIDAPLLPLIDNPEVSVVVPKVISLDVSEAVDIETKAEAVNTGEFVAKVTSNADYTLSLNAAAEGDEATSLVNMKDGRKIGEIRSILGSEQPRAGVSGWGIRKCESSENCVGDYRGLPGFGVSNTFAEGTAGASRETWFQIGVGIGPELPSGTYKTNVVVTASQK